MSTATGYAQKVIEALYENGDPVSIDAAELLERLTKNAEPEAEPIYLARRKGLDDFFTCSKDRYNELSVLDLFETKIAYLQPPRPEPARKPMTDEEMEKQYEIDKEYFGESVMRAFYNGVRFAEKHHGIGRGME
jgi:hypothetical protein